MNIIELKRLYRLRKGEIISRLNEFGCVLRKGARKSAQKDIFPELCFCLFTPQSKAKSCWEAVSILKNNKLLFSGEAQQISEHLNKVRFKNNKARYVTESRKIMGELHKRLLDPKEQANTFELRNWIVKNIKGIGYKEASHFLRNIGLGENLAILDRHILKNMKALGVIKEIPTSITPKKYFEIEEKLKQFSKKIKIPISHLDLLFWSNETGEIFK